MVFAPHFLTIDTTALIVRAVRQWLGSGKKQAEVAWVAKGEEREQQCCQLFQAIMCEWRARLTSVINLYRITGSGLLRNVLPKTVSNLNKDLAV